jgi:hypothetical protein
MVVAMSAPESSRFVEPLLSFSVPGNWSPEAGRGGWRVYARADKKMEVAILDAIAIDFDSDGRQKAKLRETLNAFYTLTKAAAEGPWQSSNINFAQSADNETMIGFLEYAAAGPPRKRGCGFACGTLSTFVCLELSAHTASEEDFLEAVQMLLGSIVL